MVVCLCFVKKWTSRSRTGAVCIKALFPGPTHRQPVATNMSLCREAHVQYQ